MWTPNSGLVGETSYHPAGGSIWIFKAGRRLREVLRLRVGVRSLQTMGPRRALAEVGDSQTRYLLTTDGGRHWTRFRLRYPTSFATPTLGLGYHWYFVGNQGRMALLVTRDGGKTWWRQPAPCQGQGALTDLLTQRLAWLMCLGGPGAGNEQKALFRTTDGGRHWQPLARAPMTGQAHGGIPGYGYPQGMSFSPDGFGIIWESRGTLYVTRDGGAHWTAKPKVAQPEVDFGFGGAAFPEGRAFVLLARGGGRPARLLATNNYGRNWHEIIHWGS